MGSMITIEKDGSRRRGIDLSAFSKALLRLAEKDPNAMFDARQTIVCIKKGFGPAWVSITNAKGSNTIDPVRYENNERDDFFMLSPGDSLKVNHETLPQACWMFHAQPSGEVTETLGSPEAPGPKIAPPGTPSYVQEAYNWSYDGEVGQSSQALVHHLILVPHGLMDVDKASQETPSDSSDWRRCWLLAQRIPYIAQNFEQMATVNESWADFVTADPEGVVEWNMRMQNFDASPPGPRPPSGPSLRIPRR